VAREDIKSQWWVLRQNTIFTGHLEVKLQAGGAYIRHLGTRTWHEVDTHELRAMLNGGKKLSGKPRL